MSDTRLRLPVLSGEALEQIENTAYRLLAEVGISLQHPEARELLHGRGCRMEGKRVLVPPDTVRWALENVSPHRTFFGREAEEAFTLGDGQVRFHSGGSLPFAFDLETGQRRLPKLCDVIDATRLLSAIPIPDPRLREQRQHIILEGEIPSARTPPPGCPFHPRCRYAEQRCTTDVPPLREVQQSGHWSACHFPERVQMQLIM